MRRLLTFPNVIALIALFVALGGGAYALSIPKNSIGGKQIRKNAVGASEIKRGAVRSSEVKNGSLLDDDFKPGQLPAGATGPPGPPGPPGAAGTARAYAHVLADATLDEAQSSGVQGVQHAGFVVVPPNVTPVGGTYCFKLDFTPKSAVASADVSGEPTFVQTNIPADFRSPNPECPSGFEAASAETYVQGDTMPAFQPDNQSFYIVFN